MQAARGKSRNWILEFDTLDTGTNPLMGWETSKDTMSELKLEFSSREKAINYAKKIILITILPNLKKVK